MRASTSSLRELLGVVEVLAERVALRRLPVQHRHVDLLGPPVLVGQRRMRLGLGRVDRRVLALAVAGWVSVSGAGGGYRMYRMTRHSFHRLACGLRFTDCDQAAGASCRAVGAQAPVDDLGLVDLEAEVVGRGQAGCVADGAVDVGDDAARPAHHVVVVVADAGFIAGHGARRLDAAHQADGGERVEASYTVWREMSGSCRRAARMIVSVSACGCRSTASITAIRGRVTRSATDLSVPA